MSFPYTNTKKRVYRKSEFWIEDMPDNFNDLFIEALKSLGYNYSKGLFSSSNSLFSIPFKFNVNTSFEDGNLTIKYQLHLYNLINGIIVILLLSAFISKFEFGTFLLFSFVVSILFYQFSLLIINTGISKKFNEILLVYKKIKDESDIETWVNETDKDCPACGEKLGNDSLFCESCGLKIRQNAYTVPLNIKGMKPKEPVNKEKKKENISINYTVKKKEED